MDHMKPIHYDIHIHPDLNDFRFKASVQILLEARQPVDRVTLDAEDLDIDTCTLVRDGAAVSCRFDHDRTRHAMDIELPGQLSGRFSLTIDYTGNINDRMSGFYRSRYVENGETRFIGVTQFQENFARMALPCMDHPGRKASFRVTMTVDEKYEAISNTSPEEIKALDDGTKRIRFGKTPVMSTYLLFFAAGDFVSLTDETDKRLRVVTLPDLISYADTGLAYGRNSLHFCEDYYDIAYPLDKMDLIPIPDFAYGAMENWGAITFRENLLLYFPDATSKAGLERIFEVVAHEIAHQWFGNLVTPSDWKYLWLNESFATYFGYGVVDHHHPQWGVWDQFLHNNTHTAMGRDALRETIAIELPGAEKMAINSSTAPIIYNKGGSILRQVEGYIGQTNFKNGVRMYLKNHAYGNAESHHLWEAFEAASQQPIIAMMKSWIDQPGHPLVTVERRGNELVLTQRRFTFLPLDNDQQWLIPITITTFDDQDRSAQVKLLFSEKQTIVPLEDTVRAYKINEGQTGFYRVRYKGATDAEALGDLVSRKILSPVDRYGLQNDLYALVRAGESTMARYLEFLHYFTAEDAVLPLTSIADNLFRSFILTAGAQRDAIQAFGCDFLERILSDIGYLPGEDDSHTTTILRDQIIWQAAVFGATSTTTFALDQFAALQKATPVHPDISRSVMQVGAFAGDHSSRSWLESRFGTTGSEHDRINCLTALGCLSSWDDLEPALEFTLKNVPPRNQFIPIVSAGMNPLNAHRMWDWYLRNLSRLEAFHPLLYERVITGIIPTAGIGRRQEIGAFFNGYLDKKPELTDAVHLALEQLAVNELLGGQPHILPSR